MIVAIAEKESMVLLNLDPTTIKSSAKDKRPSQDLTEEFFAEDVSSQELSELSSWKRSRPSKKPKSPRNDESSYLNSLNYQYQTIHTHTSNHFIFMYSSSYLLSFL